MSIVRVWHTNEYNNCEEPHFLYYFQEPTRSLLEMLLYSCSYASISVLYGLNFHTVWIYYTGLAHVWLILEVNDFISVLSKERTVGTSRGRFVWWRSLSDLLISFWRKFIVWTSFPLITFALILKSYEQLIDKIYYQVDRVESWISGNCRGPSTTFSLLSKFFIVNITAKQTHGLPDHPDSPYIRAVTLACWNT